MAKRKEASPANKKGKTKGEISTVPSETESSINSKKDTNPTMSILEYFIEYSTDLEMGSLTEGFPWEKIEGN